MIFRCLLIFWRLFVSLYSLNYGNILKKNIYFLIFFLVGTAPIYPFSGDNNEYDWIQDYITPISDFPEKGIIFHWYAPLLRQPEAFEKVIKIFAKRYKNYPLDAIASLDARGFIFGAALAYELKVPLILIRKPGKLPGKVERIDYELEYGKNSFEIEINSLKPGSQVLIIDDVLATGGTAHAASTLIERLDSQVIEIACLIELPRLKGRDNVEHPVFSLIKVDVD
ncbi:MAG: Adenine phosphoribosyltransferase [Chlamydiales bacterium]|nr:Adenine phosphoribosyltransferase [Chlamydiales bacterium]